MAPGLSAVVLLLCCASSVLGDDCLAYTDHFGVYHGREYCYSGTCCGTCENRYCCSFSYNKLSEDKQEDCRQVFYGNSTPTMVIGIVSAIVFILIVICCCVCPCCCIYKMCRKPQPVIATTTHTTVVSGTPQPYPQQPVAVPAQPQSYQGGNYPSYQPVPVQPGYGGQPGYGPQPGYGAHPGYGPQPGYGAQPGPNPAFQGQPFTAGPPPTYQEATGPSFPPGAMPYSQAAFAPGQTPYPLNPSAPGPSAPGASNDYLAQPAYNPDFVAPPPKNG